MTNSEPFLAISKKKKKKKVGGGGGGKENPQRTVNCEVLLNDM